MNFDNSQPIYLQIADYFCDKIMNEEWQAGQRVPSVREMAGMIEVNPNTAMRAYHYLQEREILMQQRGVGYFTTGKAAERVLELRRQEFLKQELPAFFNKMTQLGYTPDDLQKMYDNWHSKA